MLSYISSPKTYMHLFLVMMDISSAKVIRTRY